jgi:DNA-binding CsgD family transcriptional regulator
MLSEGRFWLEPALDPVWQSRLPDALRCTAYFHTGWLALEQGDTEHAGRYGEDALAIARATNDDSGMARAFGLLSFVDSRLGDNSRAIARMEASLAHHRAANDADSIAGALNNLAILALDAGAFERVVTYCTESRDAFTALGNLHGASHAIDTMGVALYCLGRFDEAMRCSRESLAIDRQLADKRGTAISLDHVGKCARALGDLESAWEAHAASLQLRKDLGDPRGLIVWLEAMALWLAHAGCAELAARVFGAIEVTRTASNMPLLSHEVGDHEETERLARKHLGEAAYEAHLAKGRWLTIEDAIVAVRDAAESRAGELARGVAVIPESVVARFGLTPREHEVLLLIAQRYADKEIADALFISPRTVARHVTGIFTKMGVHSRRQAAAMLNGHEPTG